MLLRGKKPEILSEALTSKRLRLGESNVDPNQPSIQHISKALFECAAGGDEEKKQLAIKELVRFELGPLRTCKTIIATCERETTHLQHLQAEFSSQKQYCEAETSVLQAKVKEAKLLPRNEIEELAKECQQLKTAEESRRLLEEHTASLQKLKEQRDALAKVLADRKKRLEEIKTMVAEFKQSF